MAVFLPDENARGDRYGTRVSATVTVTSNGSVSTSARTTPIEPVIATSATSANALLILGSRRLITDNDRPLHPLIRLFEDNVAVSEHHVLDLEAEWFEEALYIRPLQDYLAGLLDGGAERQHRA